MILPVLTSAPAHPATLHPALLLLAAYLLGSIPFGYLIIRLTQGRDIREIGSGNIGATNVLRSGKKWQGIATLLLDGGKGFLAVHLIRMALGGEAWGWMTAAAFLAIGGHVYTVFLSFKGGKGVATGCGAYLAIAPMAVLATLGIFLAVALLTRYVSLASILATLCFPIWAFLLGYGHGDPVIIYGAFPGVLLIVIKHHANIRRLLRGEEHKLGSKA